METEAPKDKGQFVYAIFLLAGVAMLLPWNFFVTAIPYFQYQLRDKNTTNLTNFLDPKLQNNLQVLFGNYIGLCSMIPLALTMVVSLFIMAYIPLYSRYLFGSFVVIGILIITAGMTGADMKNTGFLGITLACAVIINIGDSFLQSSVVGFAAFFPVEIMQAVMMGQSVAGIIAAVAQIITLTFSANPKWSALAYFLIAVVFACIATALFMIAKTRNPYFCYYYKEEKKADKKSKKVKEEDETSQVSVKDLEQDLQKDPDELDEFVEPPKKGTMKQAMGEAVIPGWCAALTLGFSLMVFPALLVSVRPYYYPKGQWPEKFFTPVVIFLGFNFTDWVGRFISGYTQWPKANKIKLLLILVILRIIFIPICLFLNQQPRDLPIAFKSQGWCIAFVILLGLTNGYYTSLAFQHAPSFASPGNEEGVGIAMCIYLATGMVCGIAISYGLNAAIYTIPSK